MGDVVKMSYEGSVDGVPFEGGKADEHDLELGSGMFIPVLKNSLWDTLLAKSLILA